MPTSGFLHRLSRLPRRSRRRYRRHHRLSGAATGRAAWPGPAWRSSRPEGAEPGPVHFIHGPTRAPRATGQRYGPQRYYFVLLLRPRQPARPSHGISEHQQVLLALDVSEQCRRAIPARCATSRVVLSKRLFSASNSTAVAGIRRIASTRATVRRGRSARKPSSSAAGCPDSLRCRGCLAMSCHLRSR
jgi:hypothetical protein